MVAAVDATKSINLFEYSKTIPVELSIDSLNLTLKRENIWYNSDQIKQFQKREENLTNDSIVTNQISLEPHWNHPLLGILLITMTIITISGNSLVILAVVRERYLKSATNYYIASLAVADLIVGLVVMPFNSLNKMTNDFWFFGDLWCDIWHSLDVFASTASINSLLFIALDRHSAISDPINYPTRWLSRYWVIFVGLIWICSAFISFPAIAYWRWTTSEYILNRCVFSDDIYYLVFSSLVSFYIPLTIMVVVYIRIYRAATNQMNAIKTGQKLNVKTGDGSPLTLRIHRGGYHKLSKVETNMTSNGFQKKSVIRTENHLLAISNANSKSKDISQKYEHQNLIAAKAVSLSLSDLPSSSSATKNSPLIKKHSLEKSKFHQIKSSSNSVLNKSSLFQQRRNSCPYALNLEMTKISGISDKSYIELNKRYLISNSLLENRINLSSLSSSLSMSSLLFKSSKCKTINMLYYPSLITRKKLKEKHEGISSNVRRKMPKKFLSSLNENDLNDFDIKESKKSPSKTNLECNLNENEKLLSDEHIEPESHKTNVSNQCEQSNLEEKEKEQIVNKNLNTQKTTLFLDVKPDYELNNNASNNKKTNLNLCLNETNNKTHTDLLDLYTGDDETIRQNLYFYQKHYIEHTNKLMKIESPQKEMNLNKSFIKKKYSTFKKLLSSQKKILNINDKANNKHHPSSLAHSRHNSNLSALSSFSHSFPNFNDNEKQPNGKFRILKQGRNYVKEKFKNLSITKKLSKFSREQKAAKTLGIVMGVFIICWLPFFIYNVITGIFKASLSKSHEFIYSMVTWLGYINSGCNPIIYSFSSRDFRRAFSKILCPKSFLLKNKRLNVTSGPSYAINNMHYEFSTNALYQNRKNFKPPPCLTCQMYENSLFTLTSKAATSNINESPVGSKHDSEKSVLLTIPSVSNFPDVNLYNSKNIEAKFDDIQKTIRNKSFYEQDNSSSFELIKYNLVKLNTLVGDNKSEIFRNSHIDDGSNENDIIKRIQEKTHSFSSSFLEAETSKRESQKSKPLIKFTRNLRRTFRNVLNQNTRPRRAATTVYNKNKRSDDSKNAINNTLRRTSGSSITSSISLTVLNKLNTSANHQNNKRALKKKALLANNLLSEDINSLSNISINSSSNPSLHNLKNNKKHKTISIGTKIKFRQTKPLNSQERESNSSFQMSLNKKHTNQMDADIQNSVIKKNNIKKNRSKIQIYSFKTANKNEMKIEKINTEIVKTTPIPIAVDDDDYFTQINSNLERKKYFASNNTYPNSVTSKNASLDKKENNPSSLSYKNSLDLERESQLDENNNIEGSLLDQASNEKVLRNLKNQEKNEMINLNPSHKKNSKTKENEKLLNGISQLNELTLELNSKTHIESTYSKLLNSSDNNANFPFGAKFFEIHGEYNL